MNNETCIELTEDDKAVVLKATKDLHFANAQLHEWLENDMLTADMSTILPANIESHFSIIAKKLDYESHLLKEKEERHLMIREANQEIRNLKEKLGSDKPVDGLPELMQHLTNKVKKWWKTEGFSYVGDQVFHPYGGLHIRLGFMLDSYFISDAPVTDGQTKKLHVEHLRDIGFEFADFEKGNGEKLKLIDNPTNRTLLLTMLQERFPSLEIHSFENQSSYADKNIFVIRDIKAAIYDLADI